MINKITKEGITVKAKGCRDLEVEEVDFFFKQGQDVML
jgi:hypothetical protein